MIVSPESYVHYLRRQKIINFEQAPKNLIISYLGQPAKNILSQYSFLQAKLSLIHNDIGVLSGLGVGSAATSLYLDSLIALGVKNIISVGYCGSLKGDLSHGEHIVIESAIGESEVLVNYGRGSLKQSADFDLSSKIKHLADRLKVKLEVGHAWSTDAFFFETQDKRMHYIRQGCTVVDMEAAALFSIAKYRDCNAAAIMVVSDLLLDSGWVPSEKNLSLKEAYKVAYNLAEKAFLASI